MHASKPEILQRLLVWLKAQNFDPVVGEDTAVTIRMQGAIGEWPCRIIVEDSYPKLGNPAVIHFVSRLPIRVPVSRLGERGQVHIGRHEVGAAGHVVGHLLVEAQRLFAQLGHLPALLIGQPDGERQQRGEFRDFGDNVRLLGSGEVDDDGRIRGGGGGHNGCGVGNRAVPDEGRGVPTPRCIFVPRQRLAHLPITNFTNEPGYKTHPQPAGGHLLPHGGEHGGEGRGAGAPRKPPTTRNQLRRCVIFVVRELLCRNLLISGASVKG